MESSTRLKLQSPDGSYLDRGIYDLGEVSRLINISEHRIETWTTTKSKRKAVLTGELDGFFSFWDLLSFRVIGELQSRGVSLVDIERGSAHLSKMLLTHRPFAHKKLATVGSNFFAEITEWEDVGKSGQQAFQLIVKPLLVPLTFNDEGMAQIWQPQEGVWLNPKIQAGAPCVEGTRVPTQTLADLISTGVDQSSVADDFRLSLDQLQAAIEFETQLKREA